MLSIITTNKNSTATAPTYTTIKMIAKKSAVRQSNKQDAQQKTKMRKKTECTGLPAATTKKLQSKPRRPKKLKILSMNL